MPFTIYLTVIPVVFAAISSHCIMKQKKVLGTVAKIIASLGFLSIGLLGIGNIGNSLQIGLFIAYLICCLIGDIFFARFDYTNLDKKYFIYGAASFTAAQILNMIYSIISGSPSVLWSLVTGVVLVIGTLVLLYLMKIKISGYLTTAYPYGVIMMFAWGFSLFAFVNMLTTAKLLFTIGLALALLSDLFLLKKYAVKNTALLTYLNQLSYYIGVTLVALSISFI